MTSLVSPVTTFPVASAARQTASSPLTSQAARTALSGSPSCARGTPKTASRRSPPCHALASVPGDDPVGALGAPLERLATRLGVADVVGLRGEVGDEHGHDPSRLGEGGPLHGRRSNIGDGQVQLWVVAQDRPLQLLQLRPGLGAELLDERPSVVAYATSASAWRPER